MAKKETKPAGTKETITLTNGQIEMMLFNQAFSNAMKKQFPFKVNYWLGRILDKIKHLAEPYQKEVNAVIDKYAETETGKDGEEKPKRRPDGNIVWGKNEKAAGDALKELREIEVDLGFHKIELDLDALETYYADLPAADKKTIPAPDDLAMLMPFFKEI